MALPTPGVSVCVAVHDSDRFLAEAVRSVLDQTYRDVEVLVVSATTDAPALPWRDPRIRTERAPVGTSEAGTRNRAVELARAPLVKVLRPADVLHPRCLELQAERMEDDPGLAMVAARRHLVDEHTRVLVPRRGLSGMTGLRTAVSVARHLARNRADEIGEPTGVLFRREDFLAVGGWRTDASTSDLDLWVRLLQHGEFLGLPESLAAVRIDRRPASADQGRAVRDRRVLLDELGRSDFFGVRPVDRAVGRLLAPLGWVRHRAVSLAQGARRAVASPPSG